MTAIRSRSRWARTGLACTTAVVVASALPAVPAEATTAKHPQTLRDTDTAMHGEALAHASYYLYARQAGRERLGEVERLFDKTARTELHDHFTKESAIVRLVRDDASNLRDSITGERYESTRMYPTFAKQAREDGDHNAAQLFSEIAQDESRHLRAFEQALDVVTHHRPDRDVPPGPTAGPVDVPAGPAEVRSARTLRNLETAMQGEAFANAKYTLYAEHAQAENRPKLANLFRRTAEVELTEHFAGEAKLAGLVQRTRANLRRSIKNETYEARTMYPGFARTARAEGDENAARLFTEIAHDEAGHARAFQAALRRLDR